MSRYAVVLAGGAGRRFGGGKLLAPWHGAPLITWAVRTALAAPVVEVFVVLGHGADAVRGALGHLADPRLAFVVADDWSDGISASLRAGLRALPADADSVAVFLGDMPRIDPAAVIPLFESVEAGAAAALLETSAEPAHPIVFGRGLFGALHTLRGDRGARSLLRGRTDVARFQTVDPGAVFDVDRPEDLPPPKAT